MRFTILFSVLLTVNLAAAGPARAQDDLNSVATGICHNQPAITDKEIRDSLEVIGDFLRLGGDLTPSDEETLIRGRGLTSDRMNCVLGKVMAGNDIFNWGSIEAYGPSLNLSQEEAKLVKKYINESQGLKEYLEQSLNIQVESD